MPRIRHQRGAEEFPSGGAPPAEIAAEWSPAPAWAIARRAAAAAVAASTAIAIQACSRQEDVPLHAQPPHEEARPLGLRRQTPNRLPAWISEELPPSAPHEEGWTPRATPAPAPRLALWFADEFPTPVVVEDSGWVGRRWPSESRRQLVHGDEFVPAVVASLVAEDGWAPRRPWPKPANRRLQGVDEGIDTGTPLLPGGSTEARRYTTTAARGAASTSARGATTTAARDTTSTAARSSTETES